MPERHLARDKQYELLKSIAMGLDMETLLDLLGREIEALDIADGYLINLRDLAGENLRSLKLRYPEGFRHLESTYVGYRTNLDEEDFSPNARAFFTGQPVRFDASTDSLYEKQIIEGWKLSQFMVLPLLDVGNPDDAAVGTLGLMKRKGHVDEAKIPFLRDLFTLFCRPLRAAIEMEALRQFHSDFLSAAEEQEQALQFIVEVNNLTSRQKIFDRYSAEMLKRFGFDCMGIFLLEDGGLKNVMVACADPRHEAIAREWNDYLRGHLCQLDHADSGVSHAFLKNALLLFKDVQEILHLPMSETDRTMMRILRTPRTLLTVPVRYQDQATGVMLLCSLTRVLEISDKDANLLDTLSAFLGAAIVNSDNLAARERQNAEIERLNRALQNQVVELAEEAATDRLTGLYNFRIFERELERRISECRRSSGREALSLVIFDIDRFKRFNDTYGHASGNQVLAGVAREISSLVRRMDTAFRYGGEEFVVLMPRCELEGSRIFAERVRKAVEAASFDTEAGSLSVTLSAGCATFLKDESQESFFSRADQALYRAKNGGRNRVES